MTGELAGRTALVTGASGSIGQAVARTLAAAGAQVIQQYRKQAQALMSDHPAVEVDFRSETWADELGAALDSVGGADVLVNAAHPAQGDGNVGDLEPEVLDRHFAAIVLHARVAGLVLPAMRRQRWGRIVYISGALMARPHPGMGAFGAAKAAGSVLTRYLALEEGRSGITANIVAPGRVVDANVIEPELDEHWQKLSDRLIERTALGSFPTPNDVAAAVHSLVVPSASAITGQTVWITGGEPIA